MEVSTTALDPSRAETSRISDAGITFNISLTFSRRISTGVFVDSAAGSLYFLPPAGDSCSALSVYPSFTESGPGECPGKLAIFFFPGPYMEFYLLILFILFVAAAADLMVGVANDAVNFLNSAVGSHAGTRLTIMIVASLGVFLGTTFSGGIMEVARKGIFNPEMFVFHDVMIIFLAVMLTDIILLDVYNTFGLPTSTTVSIVFELLGGAVALAVVKAAGSGGGIAEVLRHINTGNVLTIVSGIGLSIVFAFIFGSLIQFITRVVFTFDYEKPFRRYGGLYCGFALTAITYFILVKGAKGSVLLAGENASG